MSAAPSVLITDVTYCPRKTSLYLQDKYGVRAGKLQMALDVAIVLASLLGAVALNLVIMLNHRPGRYMAV